MNKWGIIAGILGVLFLFIPALPIGIILDYEESIMLSAESSIVLNLYQSNGILYYSAGIIDPSMVITFWFAETNGYILFILFWVVPLISTFILLFFGFYTTPGGKSAYKKALILMIIENLAILLFPTVFGYLFSFPIYLFSEIPIILGYGAYLSIFITIFTVIGFKTYDAQEETK